MSISSDKHTPKLPPISPATTEERYRAFIENSAEGIWCCELEYPVSIDLPEEELIDAFYQSGYLAECNDAFARMYGMPSAEVLIGLRLDQLLVRDSPTNLALLRAFIHAGYHLSDAESLETDSQGNRLHFSNSLIGVIQDGYLLRAWGTQRNITRQKRLENALRESEERFRHMADTAPVLIWTSGPDAQCDWFNKPWLRFTGRTMEQELGDGWMESVHPNDLAHCRETYFAAFHARQPFQMEYRLLRHDGVYRWLLDSGTPRYSEEDHHQFLGNIGSCTDITDQKQAEEEMLRLLAEKSELVRQQALLLAQQQTFLKEVLVTTTDGVLRLYDEEVDLPSPLAGEAEIISLSSATLQPLRHRAREEAIACGFSDEQQFDLLTAVGEAAMNVVVHAANGNGKGWVLSDRKRGMVQVWITDTGQGIPLSLLHRAVLQRGYTTAGSLGHGFFLLLKSADRIHLFTREGEGTKIVIEKGRVSFDLDWMTERGLLG